MASSKRKSRRLTNNRHIPLNCNRSIWYVDYRIYGFSSVGGGRRDVTARSPGAPMPLSFNNIPDLTLSETLAHLSFCTRM
jgi:hypothetical protein